jgi:hypothetical protein
MVIQPTQTYKHDGQTLHPKLVYEVPAAMGAFLVANGLAAESTEPADVDMTHLEWQYGTTLYQGGTIAPAPIVSQQA